MVARGPMLALAVVIQLSSIVAVASAAANYAWNATNIVAQWRAVACDSTCTNQHLCWAI